MFLRIGRRWGLVRGRLFRFLEPQTESMALQDLQIVVRNVIVQGTSKVLHGTRKLLLDKTRSDREK